MAEVSEFKFGMQLGFAKVHHKKSHPEEKRACPCARGAPQNWGFPFNISTITEGSDFKIGMLVGFAKAHHINHIIPPKKWSWPWGGGALKNLGFSFNIYAMAKSIDFKFGTQSGWPIRPIIKSHK